MVSVGRLAGWEGEGDASRSFVLRLFVLIARSRCSTHGAFALPSGFDRLPRFSDAIAGSHLSDFTFGSTAYGSSWLFLSLTSLDPTMRLTRSTRFFVAC